MIRPYLKNRRIWIIQRILRRQGEFPQAQLVYGKEIQSSPARNAAIRRAPGNFQTRPNTVIPLKSRHLCGCFSVLPRSRRRRAPARSPPRPCRAKNPLANLISFLMGQQYNSSAIAIFVSEISKRCTSSQPYCVQFRRCIQPEQCLC